jgi:hypothetical protein
MATENLKRQIVIGDIHGELKGLMKILMHAGLINKQGDWVGETTVLIQTGDVIDRGPHSCECIRLLRALQEQAAQAGGQVIRLCGNHEILLMEDPFNNNANFDDTIALASEIQEEILLGKIQASYTDGTRLYTHAGLRSDIRMALEKEIGIRRSGLKRLSDHINSVFIESVMTGDYETHSIFHADPVRGGNHKVGGIFWGDYSLICSSLNFYKTPQIFGHTPTWEKGVKHSHNLKLINIDAGMYIGYGGNILYLEIDESGTILQHHEDENAWIRTALTPEKISRTKRRLI